MAGYSILRLNKIKDVASIKRLAAHHERSGSDVANARHPYDARILTGSGSMVQDVLDRLPEKRRSDAVLAMEFMLTTSPETQRLDDKKTGKLDPLKVKKFEQAARDFLKNEFGGTATARIHYDETTPHVQGFVVPNDGWQAGKTLKAKTLFNPRTLSELQTRWHETLQRAGLQVERGELGSQAKHEAIDVYYARVNAPAPALPKLAPRPPEPTISDKISEAVGLKTEHSEAEKSRKYSEQQRIIALEKQHKSMSQRAKEAEAKAKNAESRALLAEKKLLAAKRQTDELRSLPLADVLQQLGCEPHKSDKHRWTTPAGDVWIDAVTGRFNSFDEPALKGRGAIDLVMRVNGSDFNNATAWLASRYGIEATSRDAAGLAVEQAARTVQKAVQSAPAPSPLPTPHPTHLERVQTYLTRVRAVPGELVSRLVQQGRIYADKFANAVFKTDDGQGCEMRGTGEKPFHGQRGQKTGFTVHGDTKRVAIVESAIEALSCHARTGMTAVSVGGANARIAAEVAAAWLGRGAVVYAAQNTDAAGERQAAALQAAVPGVHRLRAMHNDWNDDLRASASTTHRARLDPAAAAHRPK